jgi:hypothetical protein
MGKMEKREKRLNMEQEPQRKERRWTRNHIEKRKVGAGPQRKEERWSRNHRELEHQPREKRKDGAGTIESWSSNREKRGKIE